MKWIKTGDEYVEKKMTQFLAKPVRSSLLYYFGCDHPGLHFRKTVIRIHYQRHRFCSLCRLDIVSLSFVGV